MTRKRFYAPSALDSQPEILTLALDESRHLRDVLRLKKGDEVYIFNGKGKEFKCTVDEISRHSAKVRVNTEVQPARPESPLELTLAVALLKGEKFDLVVQKVTELGVARILPVMTTRADIRLRDESDASKRVLRWQRIAIEAAKQSGRARVPEIGPPLSFVSLLAETTRDDEQLKFLFSERGGSSLAEMSTAGQQQRLSIIALVGSEGGWTEEEMEDARVAGWNIITLGGRTLRAETAAIAATVLLQHLFGDLV